MGDEEQRAGVGHQRLGQIFAGVDVQVVGRLVEEKQIRPFQHDLREAQTGQLAAGQGFAGLEDRLPPEAQLRQMAADFQFGHSGVFVPDDVDDAACADAVLLLGKDAGPCARPQTHHTAGGTALAVQHLHQGGLARAIGSGDDEPLAAADRIGKGLQQSPVADLDGQVLEQHQLIPRFYVVFEAEFELIRLVLRSLCDLQLLQLFAAALGHLGGGGADEVAVDVVLQLFSQRHIGVVLLLAQGVSGFFLGQVGRKVALIGGHGLEGDLPDLGTDIVEEIAVVADHKDRTGVALEVAFQPFHRGKIQVVGRLVQNKDIRLFQQELCQTQTGQLTAGQNAHILAPCILRKAHAGQHLFDVDVHVVAVGRVDDVLQRIVLFQQRRVIWSGRHLLFQNLHLGHRVQHRGKGRAHLPVNIKCRVKLCVLFQIAQRHAVGHTEFPVIVGVNAGQDLEERRLARAVLTHDADAVFLFYTGAHVVQDDLFAKALSEFFQMNQHNNLPCSFPVGGGYGRPAAVTADGGGA